MRKSLIIMFAALIIVPTVLSAQNWRDRRSRYNDGPELSIFAGYRYGGTIFARQSDLFNENVDIASNADIGATLDVPLNPSLALELLVSHQSTNFTRGNDVLFGPSANLGNVGITYFQGGLKFPFSDSRDIHPYIAVTAGGATISPDLPGAASSTRFSFGGGIGAKINLNQNIGLKVEERGYWTSLPSTGDCFFCNTNSSNTSMWQGETNVGIVFTF